MMSLRVCLSSGVGLIYLLSCFETNFAHDEEYKYDSEQFYTSKNQGPHFIMFFAPWCGHCKRLSPTWTELGEKYNTKSASTDRREVTIAKIDCTIETSLCADQDITGYPTLKFFKPDDSPPVKYRGSRDLDALEKFVKEQLEIETPHEESIVEVPTPQHGLVELTEGTFEKFIEVGSHFVKFYAPWCGHCQQLSPVWDQLAESFQHDSSARISKIDCTQNRLACQNFEVKGYPTLLWIQDGKKVDKYSGSRTHEDLKLYVNKMKGSGDEGGSGNNGDINAVDKDESPVVQLTANNFRNGIASGTTIVKFYAPWCGHCKRLAPTWDELGMKFVAIDGVKVAKVDCTTEENKELCKENEVEGYPTLYLYKNGKKVEEYKGSRELGALHSFVLSHITHDEL